MRIIFYTTENDLSLLNHAKAEKVTLNKTSTNINGPYITYSIMHYFALYLYYIISYHTVEHTMYASVYI